jgi:Holliday junction resolvasome RuvABC endonuclease subunit
MVSKKIRIMGVDPSLRNTGIAIGEFCTTRGELDIIALRLFETEGSKQKTVRKSSDDLARMTVLHTGVVTMMQEYGPAFAVGEVPTGAQSARASFSNGACCMLFAAVQDRIPLIQVNPTEVKFAAVGHKFAAKEELIEWATTKWPGAPWLRARGKSNGALVAANEHLADACAAIVAGINTQQFKQATAMLQQFKQATVGPIQESQS